MAAITPVSGSAASKATRSSRSRNREDDFGRAKDRIKFFSHQESAADSAALPRKVARV
jgi:hypothetical protein